MEQKSLKVPFEFSDREPRTKNLRFFIGLVFVENFPPIGLGLVSMESSLLLLGPRPSPASMTTTTTATTATAMAANLKLV